ncbi:MAG: hypothetical protein AAF439_01335 [Pseudomonadota bacterium]
MTVAKTVGMGSWQVVALVLGTLGLLALVASFAGNTTTANDCGISVGGSVGGNVDQECAQ